MLSHKRDIKWHNYKGYWIHYTNYGYRIKLEYGDTFAIHYSYFTSIKEAKTYIDGLNLL